MQNLNNHGYFLPEAFTWENKQLKGYWISKYQLKEASSVKPEINGGAGVIRVKNILTQYGENYKYELYLIKDGKRIVWSSSENKYVEGTTAIDLTSNSYTFKNLEPGEYGVNIIAKNASGQIVQGIGNVVTVIEGKQMDKPDTTGFNQNTTFYVTYDENWNETSVVPIGETPPDDWYDYDDQKWANIVTRNNEKEAYFVWIPRYQYKLNQSNETSTANFIGTDVTSSVASREGYYVPEAFTWDGKEISGYWISKYQLKEGTSQMTASIAGNLNSIRVSNIQNKSGLAVTSYDAYLIKEGKIVETKTNINQTEGCEFTNLEYGKYAVQVIGKQASGNQVIAVTREINIEELEMPTLVGFMVDTTYLVTYDSDMNASENLTLRSVLKEGAEINSAGALVSGEVDLSKIEVGKVWFDYSKQIWPNIVTRNNSKEAYFVWIPRYEYILDSEEEKSRVRLIPKSRTNAMATKEGWTVPEAFTWDGKEIAGYWISKYQLRQ